MSPSPLRMPLLISLLATAAVAQEFELDLSEEKPAPVPVELRPTLGVISVQAEDGEEISASRAHQLEAELLKELAQGEAFQSVIEPSQVKRKLGPEVAKAEKCVDYACLESVAKRLKVQRLVRLAVSKRGPGSVVTMYGWDPGFNEVLVVSQDSQEKAEKASFVGMAGKSQSQKDREFMKKMNPFLAQIQSTLATPNGKLLVDNADPSAVVVIDGAEGGVGSLDLIVQRGVKSVKVTAAGYKPFVQSVAVEPLKTAEVKVTLVALPLEVPLVSGPPVAPGHNVLTKPGFYVAAVGAIAVGVGISLGLSAQSVKTKIAAGGDPVAVTRAEAKAASTNAMLANVLVGAGGAALAGGVTWILVTLPPSTRGTRSGIGEPGDSTTVSPGAFLSLGGRF